jgi:monofunctional biosynthetic peptidoglycan transglycosylase
MSDSSTPNEQISNRKVWSIRRLFWRFILIVMVVFSLWELSVLARVWWWRDHNPSVSAFMRERESQRAQAHLPPLQAHPWVPYAHISSNLKRAVLAAEDSRFLEHHGFDWEGIRLAFKKDMRKGKLVAGGSTISQQLAKNLFLSEHRSIWRKGQEALITIMIESVWPKKRILEVYLNEIEWGDGLFGCEQAARHYFGSSAQGLGPEQAALLAAMIPNPRYYDHHRGHTKLQNKTATVLARMWLVSIP